MPAHPVESSKPSDELLKRVRAVVDLIRPGIQADGGDVEVVRVHQGIVEVRFHGACIGCPSSNMTLQSGIARQLRERVPEITEVRALN
ncbi:MAG: NifU family protein [Phycisphaerales bacterium]|nr:NifU family protein [Phycisphaerales bacterium]